MRAAARLLLVIGGVCAVLSCGGCKGGRPSAGQTAEAVTVSTLANAFEESVSDANAAYGGKWLRVSGAVRGSGEWAFDLGPYLMLADGVTSRGRVQCRFRAADRARIGQLHEGDAVTVVGKCKGLSLGKVILDQCEMAPER